ncbi:uncharacterized protein V1513DRAFT_438690 [Lipomyces chichibuensis]|uniref:uncharacterized protein n=1 Tax=Lipomyces chichibuensis TaxID=1546026 RepID=UPI003343A3A5
MLMVQYILLGLLVIIIYRARDSSFIIAAVGMIFTISCIVLGIYLLKSSFTKDAGGVTVFFNATEENWVTSSDVALFNSSDRIQIAIHWSAEVFSQIINGCILVYVGALSIIFNKGEGCRKKNKDGMVIIICSAIIYGATIASLARFVWRMRRTVWSSKCSLRKQLVRRTPTIYNSMSKRLSNDVAKGLGKKLTASPGA